MTVNRNGIVQLKLGLIFLRVGSNNLIPSSNGTHSIMIETFPRRREDCSRGLKPLLGGGGVWGGKKHEQKKQKLCVRLCVCVHRKRSPV